MPADTIDPTTSSSLLDRSPEDLHRDITRMFDELRERGDALRELRGKPAEQRSTSWSNQIRATADEILALDRELTILQRAHEFTLDLRARQQSATGGPTAALARPASSPENRSLGELFVESEAYQRRSSNRRTEGVEVRNLLDTGITDPAAGAWLPVGQPIPPRPRRMRLFVRDLLPAQPTSLNSISYIQELSPATYELGASGVAEAAEKPEVTMKFNPADAPTRKIAGWLTVTEEIVEDAPTLRGYIDTRLSYMVAVREQRDILFGIGGPSQILGIMNTPGIQSQSAITGDVPATVGLAIAKVENVDAEADGLVMNPLDFWQAVTTRHEDQFDHGFSQGAPGSTPQTTFWGLRTVRSRAMPAGTALVGDWAMGASIFDRRQAVIRVTDSHDDLFIKNQLVILAEERIALAVYRPDAFVAVSIAFGA